MSQKFGPLQIKNNIQKTNPTEKKPQILQETRDKQEQENVKLKSNNTIQLKWFSKEEQYDLVRLKRLGDKIEKKMELTHRQKIETFNKKIKKMPEHYDIPKIGPG